MFWHMLEPQRQIQVWEPTGSSAPTHLAPTIIEAAKRLYENHSVEDITRHEADKVSTDRTIAYILDVIKTSREKGERASVLLRAYREPGRRWSGWMLPLNNPIRMVKS